MLKNPPAIFSTVAPAAIVDGIASAAHGGRPEMVSVANSR